MAQTIVAADADHDGVQLGEVIIEFAELIGFHSAARRIVLWVKIQHDIFLALKRGKRKSFHVGIRQLEVRRFHSNVKMN